MSRTQTSDFPDEYEQQVDEIVVACGGDLHAALKALMLLNERLERELEAMRAEMVEHLTEGRRPYQLLN
jgi:hypothetical protein